MERENGIQVSGSWPILDRERWGFSSLGQVDIERATRLESFGGPGDLLDAVDQAFSSSIEAESIVVASEHKTGSEADTRAVLQFPAGEKLLDWFMNGRGGYRSQFRRDACCGLEFNGRLVSALRDRLARSVPSHIRGFDLYEGQLSGTKIDIQRQFLVDSFIPVFAKVWMCTTRIESNGTLTEVSLGVSGAGVDVDGKMWSAPCPAEMEAWLDLKGAYLSPLKPYQGKCPVKRAWCLHQTGTA